MSRELNCTSKVQCVLCDDPRDELCFLNNLVCCRTCTKLVQDSIFLAEDKTHQTSHEWRQKNFTPYLKALRNNPTIDREMNQANLPRRQNNILYELYKVNNVRQDSTIKAPEMGLQKAYDCGDETLKCFAAAHIMESASLMSANGANRLFNALHKSLLQDLSVPDSSPAYFILYKSYISALFQRGFYADSGKAFQDYFSFYISECLPDFHGLNYETSALAAIFSIFRYASRFSKENNFLLKLIVGQHGSNVVKQGVIDAVKLFGITLQENTINSGQLCFTEDDVMKAQITILILNEQDRKNNLLLEEAESFQDSILIEEDNKRTMITENNLALHDAFVQQIKDDLNHLSIFYSRIECGKEIMIKFQRDAYKEYHQLMTQLFDLEYDHHMQHLKQKLSRLNAYENLITNHIIDKQNAFLRSVVRLEKKVRTLSHSYVFILKFMELAPLRFSLVNDRFLAWMKFLNTKKINKIRGEFNKKIRELHNTYEKENEKISSECCNSLKELHDNVTRQFLKSVGVDSQIDYAKLPYFLSKDLIPVNLCKCLCCNIYKDIFVIIDSVNINLKKIYIFSASGKFSSELKSYLDISSLRLDSSELTYKPISLWLTLIVCSLFFNQFYTSAFPLIYFIVSGYTLLNLMMINLIPQINQFFNRVTLPTMMIMIDSQLSCCYQKKIEAHDMRHLLEQSFPKWTTLRSAAYNKNILIMQTEILFSFLLATLLRNLMIPYNQDSHNIEKWLAPIIFFVHIGFLIKYVFDLMTFCRRGNDHNATFFPQPRADSEITVKRLSKVLTQK